jgi:hypothetical protein
MSGETRPCVLSAPWCINDSGVEKREFSLCSGHIDSISGSVL